MDTFTNSKIKFAKSMFFKLQYYPLFNFQYADPNSVKNIRRQFPGLYNVENIFYSIEFVFIAKLKSYTINVMSWKHFFKTR